MNLYRYYALDLLTLTKKASLELFNVHFSHALNRAGDASATISTDDPNATRSNLAAGRTIIVIQRDQTIVWAGPLWRTHAVHGTRQVQLDCLGYHSLFEGPAGQTGRFIHHEFVREDTGQLQIARDLIDYAQDETKHPIGADVNVDVDEGPAGKLRTRRWFPWDTKNIGEALIQLSEVEDGINFRYDTFWEGSGDNRTFKVVFRPREGNLRTKHVWKLGRNLREYEETEDAKGMAGRVVAVGNGFDEDMLIRTVNDVQDGFPLMDARIAHKSVREAQTLVDHGREFLGRHRLPSFTPLAVARPGPDPQLSSFFPGNEVEIRAEEGWFDTRQNMTLMGYDVSIDDDGGEEDVRLYAGSLPA